jgi:hypothetical protein
MDFTHRSKSKILKKLKIKITTFRKLALLPSSGEWRGRREEHLLSWAPSAELASITGHPVMEARCSSLLPLHSTEDGSRASFRNVVILIFNSLTFYSSYDE